MENTIVYRNRRTLRSTLFGVVMFVFGGTALAATAPTVAPLKFEYKVIDANGKEVTLENKITTGYEANRVAVDSSGNVYVSDAVSNTVSVFNTNGKLIKQINVNRAIAVGIDKDDFKYVGGSLNGGKGIFVFDSKDNGAGNLGTGWGQPGSINVFDAKSRDNFRGDKDYDVYVSDTVLNIIRRITLDADKSIIETKDYGPYVGEQYAGEKWTNNITMPGYQDCASIYTYNTYSYDRTRRRILVVPTVGVDAANGLMYVAAREIIEYLSQTPASFYVSECSIRGETSCSGNDTNSIVDTESWRNYNGSMTYVTTTSCDGNLKSTSNTTVTMATDSSYKYWNPIEPGKPSAAHKSYILVIDMNTGAILRKISSGLGDGSSGFHPNGLALDGNGRLYAAGADATSSVGIAVYDVTVNPEAVLVASSNDANNKFSPGYYMTIAYSPDAADPAKGRLFVAAADSNSVSAYSIDGGTNPANTAPAAPELLEPVSSDNAVASVNTSTPTLRIRNSIDAENDPLTYAYEVCSGSCADANPNKVASATGITGGSDNETSMTVTQELADSLYHWRTQSFDGGLTTWSDEATFCVDKENSNPTRPDAIAPKGEMVSPFASSLSWSASSDSDCSNDIITYEVTVSDVQGSIIKSLSGVGSTSVKVSDISGLVNGGTYNWTVRAADNKGGNSDYSSGSFTYLTTSVTLDSDQAGTNVYIDGNYGYYGKLLGAVPVEKSDIVPGSHFVTFIKEGYEPHHAIVNVSDPAADLANSSVAYTAAMVAASRIKLSGSGTGLANVSGGSATPFVVDYNDDGYKDIITGGKVNVYDESGQLADVIDGRVYLFIAQEQLQEDGTKKVVLIDNGAVQADGADINVGSKAVPFVVDYNNDSKKDILVGSGDGTVHLYKGTEGGFTDDGVLALKDGDGNGLVVANAAPAVVDYNNDGKKDLVIGSSDGTLRLYSNTGSDESPVFDAPAAIKADGGDLNVGSNSRAFFTDWNSDGKKDLVVGRGIADSEGNTVNLFFNVGTDDAPEFKSISGLQDWIKAKKKERGNRDYIKYLGYNQDLGDLTGGSGGAAPFVVDLDGTSARDVAVGNGSGGVSAYIAE